MKKAISIINQYGIKGTGFADDCSLLLHRSNTQHAVDIIQKVINELTIWGEKAGLRFNPQKTVAIIFTRSNKLELPNRIKMHNTEVDYSYETRYLGVQLDSKLLWTKHFNIITAKAKQYMMQLMGALCKKWGPKLRLVRWLYTACLLYTSPSPRD